AVLDAQGEVAERLPVEAEEAEALARANDSAVLDTPERLAVPVGLRSIDDPAVEVLAVEQIAIRLGPEHGHGHAQEHHEPDRAAHHQSILLHAKVFPPFTDSFCPVMNFARSEARKATASPTSSSTPMCRMGTARA